MRMSGSRRAGVVVTAVAALGVCVPLLSTVASATGTSSITGSVYEDANRNGAHDPDEAPLAGNRLDLYTSSGTWVTGALADSTGQFRFDGLADGTYVVRFATSDWLSLRSTWVPTTTDSLYFVRSVTVAGSANADFGLRKIVRSTTVGSPISAATASNGTRFESYDDVVAASTLLAAWQEGGLLTAHPSNVVVRFDVNAGNSCVTSVAGSPGTYSAFSASVWFSYLSWLDDGDRGLFHEYGHAWTIYYEQIVQQENGWGSYLAARGLSGDSRLYSDKNWDPREMIAEDYRQLFGSPNARSYALANTQIPPADQVPGLGEWMRTTFTQAPTGTTWSPDPNPAPAPASTAPLGVSDVAVNPSPVSTQATISFAVNETASVTVQVVDSAGTVVRTLLSNAPESAGTISTVWDRKNASGRKVKAGMYTVSVLASDAAGERASSAIAFQVVDLTKRR